MAQQTGWDWKKVVLAIIGVAAAIVLLLVATAAVGLVWATSTAERLGEPAPEPVASAVATRDAGGPSRGSGERRAARCGWRSSWRKASSRCVPARRAPGSSVDGAYAKAYYELTRGAHARGRAGRDRPR